MEQNFQTAATIDIGSNYLQMLIGETDPAGKIKILEDAVLPTSIGRDTFNDGRIKQKTTQELCEALKNFSQLMKDYKVKHYRAVSRSGIREAENREYVLELIRLKTRLEVEVINSAQERFYMYKALRYYLPELLSDRSDTSLVVNLAAGGVETSVFQKISLKFSEYLRLGPLRLRETLADLEAKTIDFPSLMEEYIDSKLYLVKKNLQNIHPTHFVIFGNEIKSIIQACGGKNKIEIKELSTLFETGLKMSDNQIARHFGLTEAQAATFLPTILIVQCFLKLTTAKSIYAPDISLKHGLLCDFADQHTASFKKGDSNDQIISSVWYIANRFGADKKHAEQVSKLALSIFDQTWKLHRLEQRERLYLQIASILHAVGYYINVTNHFIHAYRIISHQKIMGLSDRELKLIANIVRFHKAESPSDRYDNFEKLTHAEKIVVAKLTSILKLAESLDFSHKNKIDRIKISQSADELIFTIDSHQDPLLEEWAFYDNVALFEDMIGMQVQIRRRG